jgi:hypothetical protein
LRLSLRRISDTDSSNASGVDLEVLAPNLLRHVASEEYIGADYKGFKGRTTQSPMDSVITQLISSLTRSPILSSSYGGKLPNVQPVLQTWHVLARFFGFQVTHTRRFSNRRIRDYLDCEGRYNLYTYKA